MHTHLYLSQLIPQNHLFYLHQSQDLKFYTRDAQDRFQKYYDLATGEAASTGIEYFSTEILGHAQALDATHPPSTPINTSPPMRRRRSPSGLFFSEVASQRSDDLFGSDNEQERRKRARNERNSSPINLTGDFLPTPSISDEVFEVATPIKTEDEERMFIEMKDMPKNDLITIFVGRNSQEHKLPTADLVKSPVLNGWLHTDSNKSYVMHPDLTKINNQHFVSIIRYMHMGEYLPKMVDIPTGISNGTPVTRKGLGTLRTSEQYSKELIRAGHLYLLAELFQVEGLTDYIYARITTCEFQKYGHEAMLALARTVFSRPQVTTGPGDESEEPQTLNNLEEWILRWLAFEFQSIMKKNSKLFFQVAGRTGKAKFFQRLLRVKAEQVDSVGGEPDQLDD